MVLPCLPTAAPGSGGKEQKARANNATNSIKAYPCTVDPGNCGQETLESCKILTKNKEIT